MRSPHILLVDDEPDAKDLFAQKFRKEIRKGTYEFEFARSGHEALEMLQSAQEENVTLVLSDLNMPGMTGAELLEEIRQHWPNIPVFMITAYGDASTERALREKGASEYLTKPVDFGALKSHIENIITGVRS
jgi:CheY-like chemotaxis protein